MKRISKFPKGAIAAVTQLKVAGWNPLSRFYDGQTTKSEGLGRCWLRPLAKYAILPASLLCSITVGATEISHSPEDEYVQQINATKTVAALDDNLFGDSINEYSGRAQFSVTDVSLPGNSGLAVTLARHLDVQSVAEAIEHKQPFSEWDLDIPYLHMTESIGYQWRTGTPNVRCAQSDLTKAAPPNGDGSDLIAGATWHGNFLYVPGHGDSEILHLADAATNKPTDGASYHWVTKDQWYLSCLPTTANGWAGDSFLARSPDGTKYWFNQFAAQQIPELVGIPYDYGQGIQIPQTAPRDEVRIMPTRVEDRFGNYVTYAYDPANPQRLLSITANDGRQITLTYGANGHVSSVSDGTRVWTYQYYNNGSMSGVTLPDGSKWAYVWPSDYDFKTIDSVRCGYPGSFNPSYRTITFTHPSGAVGSFTFKYRAHGRTYVPQNCKEIHDFQELYSMSWDRIPPFFVAFSLETKQITGPGVPTRTWTWTYPAFYWAYAANCSSGSCPTTKMISVTEPDGSVTRNTYGMQYAVNDGMLLKTERLPSATASAIRTTTIDYQLVPTGQVYGPVGDSFRYVTEPNAGTPLPVRQIQIAQQGATFTWQVNNTSGVYSFDNFARPVIVTKSSSLGNTRTDVTAYFDDLSKWVFGQVKTVTKTVPAPSVVVSQTDYDANDLPWHVYSFGRLENTFTYNADGSLATSADGNGNVTTLSNWKRGLPQAIKYPATPEAPSGASVAAIVDNLGQINAVTDENGYKTCYTYDPLGRMASITYPSETTAGVCDTSAWNTTTQSFAPYTAGAEHGIPAGHWKQTITNGNAVKVSYFDAMWRPLIEEKYDNANLVPTRSYVVKAYDLAGRLAYQSYPFQTLQNMYTTVTVGTARSYDALGRVYEVDQDSELGTLATTTQYLTGFTTKVTLPGWQGTSVATTTSYMAYDQPTTDWPVTISLPEGANTVIYRNEFGNPVYVTRKDATGAVSATRTYVYDANQLLCKTIDPESAATLTDYDLAGNPAWSASGQALFTTACDRTSVPVGSRTIRTYDARNRISALTFPDGHGNKTYTYAPDGQTSTISTTNSDTSLVTTTYGYNKRRLPVSEQLAWGSTLWTVGYGYDANANLSNTTYPNGMIVTYTPNALGQATQAGTYATGVTYYPNGAIKNFTYGNGIVHTLTLNARQLPDTSRDAGTAADVLNDGYDYDGDGNVAAITDALPGGRGNRNMTYDGLDRLKTAQSVMFGNTGAVATASYSYDVLDNLTQVNVPATALASAKNNFYCYDTSKWLLTSVRTGSCAGSVVTSLSYDVQGNVFNKNGQVYNFDKENRMLGVNSSITYRYDGLGRRVTAVIGPSNPQTTSYLYSKDGQLLYERTNSSVTADIYLSGSLVARTSLATTVPGAVYVPKYQHTDALGSPVAVTDANQAVTLRSEYEPYGALLNRTLLDGPGYTGHVSDSATGLSYMQQRYYDPQLGRFLSVDPVSADPNVGGNFNRYWYANNNPYRFTDPDGRNPPGCGDGHCRGIMLFGTLAQRQAVYQRIQEMKAASPELKRRVEALEHSKYAHRIKDSSLNPVRRNWPANVNLTSPIANESNHVGTGTTTYYNANQWMTPVGSRMGSPGGVFAHEVLSHAFDKNQGTNDSSKDPATGFDRDEERANDVEKIYVESAKPQKKDK